jgi:hypothetical protein
VITEAEGRALVAHRYKVPGDVPRARRTTGNERRSGKDRADEARSRLQSLRRRVGPVFSLSIVAYLDVDLPNFAQEQ